MGGSKINTRFGPRHSGRKLLALTAVGGSKETAHFGPRHSGRKLFTLTAVGGTKEIAHFGPRPPGGKMILPVRATSDWAETGNQRPWRGQSAPPRSGWLVKELPASSAVFRSVA